MLDDRRPFQDSAVERAYSCFDHRARKRLLDLREMIFEAAEQMPRVGRVEETLKWGQPAYLTPETKAGSTLRLGVPRQGGVAIFAHCQTTIISDFRHLFPRAFSYDGNRAVLLDVEGGLDINRLRFLIAMALTYHLKRPAG